MRAVEHREHMWHCRLHAKGDPIEPAGAEFGQRLGRDTVRVRLRRYLSVGSQAELGVDGVEDAGEIGRRKLRRRAAAEEDRLNGASLELLASLPNLGDGGVGVRRPCCPFAELVGCVGVEVAVAAPNRAERDVDVNAEGRQA